MSESSPAIEPVIGSRSAAGAIPSELVLGSHEWGMLAFLLSEAALFSTLIVVYLTYVGADKSGPTSSILSLPLVIGMTACLLSSSVTVHLATKSLRSAAGASFVKWWLATILLAIAFLAGTGFEWHNLIGNHGLTISTNLFGTTYYTLVGFHAVHVTVGVIVMLIMLKLALGSRTMAAHQLGIELVSWYWHFVDVVWIAVFTVVYVVGR